MGAEPLPLVSVIVPTYNRQAELDRALKSIMDQSYPRIEIIVVNDGTADIGDIVEFHRHKRKIVYVKHDRNRGAGAARNTGLMQARGEYIAYLDDDDCYLPGHIATLANHLVQHPELIAAYTLANQVINDSRQVTFNQAFSRGRLLISNYIPSLCIMHRRSILEQSGYWDEELGTLEDWEFLVRLALAGDFGFIPEVTAEYFTIIGDNHRNRLEERSIDVYRTVYTRYAEYASPEVVQAQETTLAGMIANLERLKSRGRVLEAVG
jgi:glycosyltransferase involved in cell wall biosynthesis